VSFTEDERRAPLRALLAEAPPDAAPAAPPTRAHRSGEAGASGGGGGGGAAAGEPVEELSGTQLRDRLIARDPLDAGWIARVNQVQPQRQPVHADKVELKPLQVKTSRLSYCKCEIAVVP